jgi:ATP-dependent Clp protease ATP-binding subunit ClpC
MEEIAQRLDEIGISVEMTETARHHLADMGFHAEYGARPLRRLLQKRVENELSKRLLRAEYRTGDEVLIDFAPAQDGEEDKLIFVRKDPEPIAVEWSPGKQAEANSESEQKGSQD